MATDANGTYGNEILDNFGERALRAAEPFLEHSAHGVIYSLHQAVAFAFIDQSAREVVVNYRSVVLGIVASALEDAEPNDYESTATFLLSRLRRRFDDRAITDAIRKARVPLAKFAQARSDQFNLVFSRSVNAILIRARDYASRTGKNSGGRLRHLCAAMFADKKHTLNLQELGWQLEEPDRKAFAADFFAFITSDASPDELREWEEIFSDIEPGFRKPRRRRAKKPDVPLPPLRRSQVIAGYSSDRTQIAWTSANRGDPSVDPLRIRSDVTAMARLICHDGTEPPLSIAIFGDWGSGKTTFMNRLREEVADLAKPRAGETPRAGPQFVSPIVQIEFNAWQFADANLWASLTAEFFDQLRAGGCEKRGQVHHASLIERVNQRVQTLTQEAVQKRLALATATSELDRAKNACDRAATNEQSAVAIALADEVRSALDRNVRTLINFGILPEDAEEQKSAFIEIAQQARNWPGRLKLLGRSLRRCWLKLVVGGVVLALLALFVFRFWTPLVALVAPLAGLVSLLWWALPLLRTLSNQLKPLGLRIDEAQAAAVTDLMQKQDDVTSAEGKLLAVRAETESAERALARLVDPKLPANPPRILRYLLEDDPSTKTFEQELGLMGRVRRAFDVLSEIMENNCRPPKPHSSSGSIDAEAVQSHDPTIPQRIVVYIDDLDRCSHEQVYEVLQAVHLLLAFKSFVVVVGVDMAWVQEAIANHFEFKQYQQQPGSEDDVAKRALAIKYLSKIFQVPFWLRPLPRDDPEDDRYRNYIDALVGSSAPPHEAGRTPPEVTAQPVHPVARAKSDHAEPGGSSERSGEEQDEDTPNKPLPSGQRKEEAEAALATLQLDTREIAFLKQPKIAALAPSDPRGVKRLVNVYKLVRSRQSEEDEGAVLGDNGRAPSYPLIALLAAIETGQANKVVQDFYGILDRWTNRAEPMAANPGLQDLPRLREAVEAVDRERGDTQITLKDVLDMSRVVRRYSFNRYD